MEKLIEKTLIDPSRKNKMTITKSPYNGEIIDLTNTAMVKIRTDREISPTIFNGKRYTKDEYLKENLNNPDYARLEKFIGKSREICKIDTGLVFQMNENDKTVEELLNQSESLVYIEKVYRKHKSLDTYVKLEAMDKQTESEDNYIGFRFVDIRKVRFNNTDLLIRGDQTKWVWLGKRVTQDEILGLSLKDKRYLKILSTMVEKEYDEIIEFPGNLFIPSGNDVTYNEVMENPKVRNKEYYKRGFIGR